MNNPFPRRFFTTALASIVLLGAFSRFTHGEYTPWFYQYQQSHLLDDGSATPAAVPYVDLILGILLFVRSTRLPAAVVSAISMIIGMVQMYQAEKDCTVDCATVAVATLAVFENLNIG